VPEIALAIIVAQAALVVYFLFAGWRVWLPGRRAAWEVMSSNILMMIAVALVLVSLIDMDRQRDAWAVANDALTRLRERMEAVCH
jgi:hypothetical protein